jgi:hypothetical protein
MKRVRLRIGDVLKVETAVGPRYVQFLGETEHFADCIRVQTKPSSERFDSANFFCGAYFAFCFAKDAIKAGVATVVGNTPSVALPTRWRRHGVVDRDGRTVNWIVHDEHGDRYPQTALSEDEQALPIGMIWNHALLVNRLEEGWRPEFEKTMRAAQDDDLDASPPETDSMSVQHYLYVPVAGDAKNLARTLRTKGFAVEVRRSADGKQWLVLATHEMASGEEMDPTRDLLEALVRPIGGEYDGWEKRTP